jgi:hypothetical protein
MLLRYNYCPAFSFFKMMGGKECLYFVDIFSSFWYALFRDIMKGLPYIDIFDFFATFISFLTKNRSQPGVGEVVYIK